MLTCLQIIQTVCKRVGIVSPNSAIGSTDQQIIQLVSLSEEEGQEQAKRYPWQVLQGEATFTTVAAQVQGNMDTIAPGWDYIVNDTIWNRSLRRPVYGPRSPQDWQQQKAMQINGPFNSFRIIGGQINFYPVPAAGQTCAFEYVSRNWITDATGGTSSVWTDDADVPLLDDGLLILGTRWRWKQAKGLDYSEDYATYERALADKMNRDSGKAILNLTGTRYDIQPAIVIPTGSWSVP